jgi:hypothetical protein
LSKSDPISGKKSRSGRARPRASPKCSSSHPPKIMNKTG